MLLVIIFGLQDTATVDVAEQFVTCPLHEFLFAQTNLRSSFHERAFRAPSVVFIARFLH
jgi:hypothetical protein